MNGVPACYNPAHHHERPEESVEALPDFFREIYETAQTVKPGSLVEFCPCGTAYSFFTMPHFNMSVASDPGSSFQVRTKAKTLKGLMGDSIPYFGDHVELSDGGDDFASTVGVGGVVGTQFVLPSLAEKRSKSDLTARAKKSSKPGYASIEKKCSRKANISDNFTTLVLMCPKHTSSASSRLSTTPFMPSIGRGPLNFVAWRTEPMTSLTTSTERSLEQCRDTMPT